MTKVYTLSAFAKTSEGGNPAGVCLDADNLSEEQMQKIAAQVGFSETAFVQKSKKADFKVRFFTPTNEIALCGHATIATFSLMFQKGKIPAGKYRQETKAGVLGIEIMANGLVFMNQNPPQYLGVLTKEKIAECLNLKASDIDTRFPVEIVNTGVPTIVVPLSSLETLLRLKPTMKKILDVTKKYQNSLMYVFTRETKSKSSTAHGRMFAPSHGIDEESATGMANGALACYLFKHDLISDPSNLIFEQGYSMNKPSEIFGKLKIDRNEIKEVIIGGTAMLMKELEIYS